MAVTIRLLDSAFDPGGLLAGQPKHKTRYIMNSGVESSPHIAHKTWAAKRNPGNPQPPNSVTLVLQGTSPSWFDTAEEFNLLPYSEVRAQIANEVERGVMTVIASTGATATVTQIRNGTVP